MPDEDEIRRLINSNSPGTVTPTKGITGGGTAHGWGIGKHLHYFPSLDSTNTKAGELAAGGAPDGTVVFSLEQTAGRGRQGRVWTSEKGKNLLLSVVLRPRIDPERLGIISLYASVSVASCVEKISAVPAGCKWPNDVLISGRKVCGILSESVLTPFGVDAVILGIGLNVNQVSFAQAPGIPAGPGRPDGPEMPGGGGGLGHTATSLRLETGREHDLAHVFCTLLSELERRTVFVMRGGAEDIIAEWTRRSVLLGSTVRVERGGSSFSGIARGVGPNGALRVETPEGTVDVVAGEVHLL